MAKRYEEKMKLEFEITRAHKCADLMKKGFMYRPGTTNSKMCQDIVPIVKTKPPKKEKKWTPPLKTYTVELTETELATSIGE